jgi:hypothetical protein
VYLALIGDLVASRQSAGRVELPELLQRLLGEQNRELGPGALAAPLALTAGDEVQGLFRGVAAAVAPGAVGVLQKLTDELAILEQPILFGLGFGPLSTGPVPEPPGQAESPALLDGPCFHRAREALERARKGRRWVVCAGFGDLDRVLDSHFELMGVIRAGWTAKQRVYAAEKRLLELQKDLAERHNVSPSVVSESLKAANFEAIQRAEQAAFDLLRLAAERAERPEREGER